MHRQNVESWNKLMDNVFTVEGWAAITVLILCANIHYDRNKNCINRCIKESLFLARLL